MLGAGGALRAGVQVQPQTVFVMTVSREHCGLTGLRSALEGAWGSGGDEGGRTEAERPAGGGRAEGRPGGGGTASVGSGRLAAGWGLHAATSGSGGLEPEPEPPGHAGSAPRPPATLSARLTLPSPGPDAGGGPGRTAACPRGPGAPDEGPCSVEGVGHRDVQARAAGAAARRASVCPSVRPSTAA